MRNNRGGVVCRPKGSTYEIAAGHHRVAAALAAGIKVAHVFAMDIERRMKQLQGTPEGKMLRVPFEYSEARTSIKELYTLLRLDEPTHGHIH